MRPDEQLLPAAPPDDQDKRRRWKSFIVAEAVRHKIPLGCLAVVMLPFLALSIPFIGFAWFGVLFAAAVTGVVALGALTRASDEAWVAEQYRELEAVIPADVSAVELEPFACEALSLDEAVELARGRRLPHVAALIELSSTPWVESAFLEGAPSLVLGRRTVVLGSMPYCESWLRFGLTSTGEGVLRLDQCDVLRFAEVSHDLEPPTELSNLVDELERSTRDVVITGEHVRSHQPWLALLDEAGALLALVAVETQLTRWETVGTQQLGELSVSPRDRGDLSEPEPRAGPEETESEWFELGWYPVDCQLPDDAPVASRLTARLLQLAEPWTSLAHRPASRSRFDIEGAEAPSASESRRPRSIISYDAGRGLPRPGDRGVRLPRAGLGVKVARVGPRSVDLERRTMLVSVSHDARGELFLDVSKRWSRTTYGLGHVLKAKDPVLARSCRVSTAREPDVVRRLLQKMAELFAAHSHAVAMGEREAFEALERVARQNAADIGSSGRRSCLSTRRLRGSRRGLRIDRISAVAERAKEAGLRKKEALWLLT